MRILIIANARRKGGLSGSDNIYLNFKKYWPESISEYCMMDIDYKPFTICYIHRVILGCIMALFEPQRFDVVYSASDFWMDSLPALIFKLRGSKWVAGFFLFAPRENFVYYYSQKLIKLLIEKYSDMILVTNPSMYRGFEDSSKTYVDGKSQKMSWINGGIDLSLAGLSNEKKEYDAVFCGRIHKSKGIDELIEVWSLVKQKKPEAKLAIIGDGDLGLQYIRNKILLDNMGIFMTGYLGEERYSIYKKSKIVLYPTPKEYNHFSMSPVEAMACGCPMVAFNIPVMAYQIPAGTAFAETIGEFAYKIIRLLEDKEYYSEMSEQAYRWASQFDYKKESLRVYEDMKRILF